MSGGRRRFGSDPPDQLDIIRNSTSPTDTSLLRGSNNNVGKGRRHKSLREGWRQFLSATIMPVAQLVQAEMTSKLNSEILLDFTSLRASDVAGKSRAFGTMVASGLSIEDSLVTSGLKDEN